mmetsp:Transcript_6804/g.18827  ORF Transcript_6804/g.18827 Transcript_6804/m.18827 type:complete len:332 (-) Transcript_6804:204-1199(-)
MLHGPADAELASVRLALEVAHSAAIPFSLQLSGLHDPVQLATSSRGERRRTAASASDLLRQPTGQPPAQHRCCHGAGPPRGLRAEEGQLVLRSGMAPCQLCTIDMRSTKSRAHLVHRRGKRTILAELTAAAFFWRPKVLRTTTRKGVGSLWQGAVPPVAQEPAAGCIAAHDLVGASIDGPEVDLQPARGCQPLGGGAPLEGQAGAIDHAVLDHLVPRLRALAPPLQLEWQGEAGCQANIHMVAPGKLPRGRLAGQGFVPKGRLKPAVDGRRTFTACTICTVLVCKPAAADGTPAALLIASGSRPVPHGARTCGSREVVVLQWFYPDALRAR